MTTFSEDQGVLKFIQLRYYHEPAPWTDLLSYTIAELSGDVHFNDDLKFTLDSNGTNLHYVTLHELGHSLGLDHSWNNSAIMFAYYRGDKGTDFKLHPDDVKGIQNIYGE